MLFACFHFAVSKERIARRCLMSGNLELADSAQAAGINRKMMNQITPMNIAAMTI